MGVVITFDDDSVMEFTPDYFESEQAAFEFAYSMAFARTDIRLVETRRVTA